MDHLGDIGENRNAAAAWPTSGSIFVSMCEMLSAFKKLVTDKAALQRGDLDTLRPIVLLSVFTFMLVVRLVNGWRKRADAAALSRINFMQRNLRHPPQAWAAP